jgi:hypothetical protein
MTHLNEAQAAFMAEMANDNPFQVVIRATGVDSPDKRVTYDQLNIDADGLIVCGMVQDVTSTVTKPSNIDREFRVLGITKMGMSFFGEDQTGTAHA